MLSLPARRPQRMATSVCFLDPARLACRHRSPRLAAAVAAPSPPPPSKAMQGVVDVVVATTSNLINAGIFGAIFGLISGAWTHRSFAGAFGEAKVNGRSWGGISGIYAGLQTASRVIRDKDDRFNSVVGACGSGAVFTMKNGPRAAAQGCVSFAALSYMIDVFTTPKDGPSTPDGAGMSDEAVLRKRR